mmetsp:Transcript_9200/g.21347  ORF Transcript_9200/g.21347 Transcript_9200/m.21347 type:complete len:210 (+) Transcript_9200:98-727(+)
MFSRATLHPFVAKMRDESPNRLQPATPTGRRSAPHRCQIFSLASFTFFAAFFFGFIFSSPRFAACLCRFPPGFSFATVAAGVGAVAAAHPGMRYARFSRWANRGRFRLRSTCSKACLHREFLCSSRSEGRTTSSLSKEGPLGRGEAPGCCWYHSRNGSFGLTATREPNTSSTILRSENFQVIKPMRPPSRTNLNAALTPLRISSNSLFR